MTSVWVLTLRPGLERTWMQTWSKAKARHPHQRTCSAFPGSLQTCAERSQSQDNAGLKLQHAFANSDFSKCGKAVLRRSRIWEHPGRCRRAPRTHAPDALL